MRLPSKGNFRCEMPSWGKVASDSKRLCGLIKSSGYNPDIVVAICRGGIVPARLVCDYYVRKITQWRWVIFPWHIWEDLTGLIKNIKATGVYSEEDIRRELKSKYDIEVQVEMIKEILSEIG